MTVCIHCEAKPRERGVYCQPCHDAALQRLWKAQQRPRTHRPHRGVQRQKFDARTCPCWAPVMNNPGTQETRP